MGTKSRVLWGAILVILVPVLLFSVFYPVVATSSSGISSPPPDSCIPSDAAAAEADAGVVATATLEADGTVNVSYEANSIVGNALVISPPSGAEFSTVHGFDETTGGSQYVWNYSAESQWVTYRMDDHNYPAADNWTLAQTPHHVDGPETYFETADAGYVGSNTIYFGEFDRVSRSVGCQEFHAIVPSAVHSEFAVEERLDDIEAAARHVRSNQTDESVHVFVVPGESELDEGIGGYAIDSDIVVRAGAFEPIPSVVWIHEYLHTLQDYDPEPDLEWTVEGLPTYLAFDVAVESGRLTPLERDMYLDLIASGSDGTALTDAGTQEAAYLDGAAVFTGIDADLRAESNGSAYDVFRWLNTQSEPDHADLEAYLSETAELDDETVESHTAEITGESPVTVDFVHAPSEMPLAGWLVLELLLHPDGRLVSGALLGLISGVGCWKLVLGRLTVDPEHLEF